MSPLVAVFLLTEALDLALYWQLPAAEGGPLGTFQPAVVAVIKVAAVLGIVVLSRAVWPKGRAFVLSVGIAVAAFGAGTAAAVLSMVRA